MTLIIPTPAAVHGISQERHLSLLLKALESVLEDAPHLMMGGGAVDLMELAENRVLEREMLLSKRHDRRSEE